MNIHEHMGHSQHHLIQTLSAADPWQIAGFAAIFSYSFLVSLHCAGMCGPLACSVLGRSRQPSFTHVVLYNLGRLISYVFAGALVGLISAGITQGSLSFGQGLSWTAGCLLILWAVFPFLRLNRILRPLPTAWLQQMQKRLFALPIGAQAFGLGLMTVLLPCMTLHPLLLASVGSGSAWAGGLTMLAFYLGTLPAMVSATYVPSLIASRLPVGMFTWMGRLMLACAGIITIWRTY